MGLIAETNIFNQLKKGQGETNQRLDDLIAAQHETNRLLSALLSVLQSQVPAAPQQWGRPPGR